MAWKNHGDRKRIRKVCTPWNHLVGKIFITKIKLYLYSIRTFLCEQYKICVKQKYITILICCIYD